MAPNVRHERGPKGAKRPLERPLDGGVGVILREVSGEADRGAYDKRYLNDSQTTQTAKIVHGLCRIDNGCHVVLANAPIVANAAP